MDNNKHDNSMMWMMVICCALPLLFLLFAGSAVFASGYLRYVIFGAFALAGVWMMFRMHGSSGKSHEGHDENQATQSGGVKSPDSEKKDHSCCH